MSFITGTVIGNDKLPKAKVVYFDPQTARVLDGTKMVWKERIATTPEPDGTYRQELVAGNYLIVIGQESNRIGVPNDDLEYDASSLLLSPMVLTEELPFFGLPKSGANWRITAAGVFEFLNPDTGNYGVPFASSEGGEHLEVGDEEDPAPA